MSWQNPVRELNRKPPPSPMDLRAFDYYEPRKIRSCLWQIPIIWKFHPSCGKRLLDNIFIAGETRRIDVQGDELSQLLL